MTHSEVHNIDCMEFMRTLPDKFFDLAIVDPPYGRGITKKNKHQRHNTKDVTYKNKTIPPSEYFIELERISKSYIVFGMKYMYHEFKAGGSMIIWDKGAEPDLHHMDSCDVAYYSNPSHMRKVRLNWCGAVKCENADTIHIHQKPVALYKWLLQNYARQGDKIFDSHMGSQSSRIAAYHMGFDYWGCELDPYYFRDGNKRFEQEKMKQELFKPQQELPKQLSIL